MTKTYSNIFKEGLSLEGLVISKVVFEPDTISICLSDGRKLEIEEDYISLVNAE